MTDLYSQTAYAAAKQLTNAYSTSFGSASRLFDPKIRPHIYAIYAFSRLGDEIVDTYKGKYAGVILDDYERQTHNAISQAYSANPILHAFQETARAYGIDDTLLNPFFVSMRMDLQPQKTYTQDQYNTYIHGSAEVIGLMCLRIFVQGNQQQYDALAPGAAHLGAAFQKINFLRDFGADTEALGRSYFPNVNPQQFTEADKNVIIADIANDLRIALPALKALPKNSRAAVMISYEYFAALLKKLENASADTIARQRLRIPDTHKAWIFGKTIIREKVA